MCETRTRGAFATFVFVCAASFARVCASAQAQCCVGDPQRDKYSVSALFERLERGLPYERDASVRELERVRLDRDARALVAIDRRRSQLEAELAGVREAALVEPIRALYRETCRLRVTVCERLRTLRDPNARVDAATRTEVARLVEVWCSNAEVRVECALADALDDHRWCLAQLRGSGELGVELASASQLPDWMRWSDPGRARNTGACALRVATYGESERDFDGMRPACRVHTTVARPLAVPASPPREAEARWTTALNGVRAMFGTRGAWWCDATSAVLRRRERELRELVASPRPSAESVVRTVGRFEPAPGTRRVLGRVLVLKPLPAPTLVALAEDDAVLRFCACEDLGDVATLVFEDALIVAESVCVRGDER